MRIAIDRVKNMKSKILAYEETSPLIMYYIMVRFALFLLDI